MNYISINFCYDTKYKKKTKKNAPVLTCSVVLCNSQSYCNGQFVDCGTGCKWVWKGERIPMKSVFQVVRNLTNVAYCVLLIYHEGFHKRRRIILQFDHCFDQFVTKIFLFFDLP